MCPLGNRVSMHGVFGDGAEGSLMGGPNVLAGQLSPV
jgi:hypothetical protein